jgi:glutamate synthase domain-containing protein 2
MIWWILAILGGFMVLVVIYDLLQKKHAILRNFPVIGHFRYIFESVGPELRQYIVTNNDEERPFSRDQRRWVYSSSKRENNYFGFGTDNDPELTANYIIIKHAAFPISSPHPGEEGYDPSYRVPCAKTMGAHRQRKKAFRPDSIVNISGMSYGALSARAVEALNRGASIAGCLQNTGEGGVSPYHQMGGELIWQIGTGYFGCRDEYGKFSMERLVDTVAKNPIRAIEIKLSQGAKPGLGGLLPAAKVTREISAIRGIPIGKDCVSPSGHTAFRDVDSMLDFVESLADATGLPVGIKSAIGETAFWHELADHMAKGDRGVDFVTVDGGEGGTGAAPLVFSDHVSLPFKLAMSRVYAVFMERGLHDKVVFAGSGKLGFPATGLLAMAMGCDLIHVARETMLAIGCIQAQRCHSGHCPTGIATQNKWLMHGLDPTSKAVRAANYIVTLRKELLQLSHACGVEHPSLMTLEHFEILDDRFRFEPAMSVLGYRPGQGHISPEQRDTIRALMQR